MSQPPPNPLPYQPYPQAAHPPTSTTYPYGAYHPAPHSPYGHPGTPGAYSYQSAGPYQAGVTGYGWTYPYSYVPQHPQPQAQRSSYSATPASATTHVPSTPNTGATPQRTTFSSYTPTYARETVAAASTGGATGRSSRKQSNVKGLFTKELKNLMYGFGDDRNPANDTVNVMEEILVEFIMDVCQTAGSSTRKSRLSIEDLRRVLSRPVDAKKLARMEELLFMQEDIKRARAQFDEGDIPNPRGS